MLLCSSRFLKMLLCSSWHCTWVHQTWVYDVFLGLFNVCQMNFSALFMSSVICTYLRMLLHNVFSDLLWNACRREESGSTSSCLCFWGISLAHVLYQIPYVSIYDWMIQDLSFLILFSLFTYCTVYSLKHVLNWTFWTSECFFVSLRMIRKTPIWCNQLYAVFATSKMIFLLEYS